MAETGDEETSLKTPKQQQGWPTISNTARKYNKKKKTSEKLRQRILNARASTFWATN